MKPILIGISLLLAISSLTFTSKAQTSESAVSSTEEFKLPAIAVAAGIDGTIRIGFKVDKTGTVKDVQILAGPAWPCGSDPGDQIKLTQKAVKANVLAMKFEPAMDRGKPVSSEGYLDFKLGGAFDEAKEQEDRLSGRTPAVVSAGLLNGRALSLPSPRYPSNEKFGPSGSVRVRVLIGEDGKIVLAGAENGPPLFHNLARNAACAAKFAPTVVQGKVVRVIGYITYEFKPGGLRGSEYLPPQ